MESYFKDYNITLTKNQAAKLNVFKELLQKYNKSFNITAITEDTEIYIKHFLDSALGAKLFKENSRVIEIGSGGGFPSVVLAIMREDLHLTLVEATGKKCEFLKIVKDSLNLVNIEIINGRAEVLARDISFREKFDCVTARAVARLNTLLEYCVPFIKIGGSLIAYKGDASEEIIEAKNALKILGCKIESVSTFELYGGRGKRDIISIKKMQQTPDKYPRSGGKERTRPL